jgi:hypothetical protein
MSQNILFYSNLHDYSKKIYSLCNQFQLNLLYVCVDDPNINLPTFVEAVPLLYITNQKRIIVDEGVEMWVNSQKSQGQGSMQSQGQVQNPSNQNTNTIDYESLKKPVGELNDNFTGGTSFSYNFSSLDEGTGDLDGGCGFFDLNGPSESIYTPKDTEGSKQNTAQMFEQYSKNRNQELQR